MGKFIKFPFAPNGSVDFPLLLGYVVTVAGAVWIARKLPILKKAV